MFEGVLNSALSGLTSWNICFPISLYSNKAVPAPYKAELAGFMI